MCRFLHDEASCVVLIDTDMLSMKSVVGSRTGATMDRMMLRTATIASLQSLAAMSSDAYEEEGVWHFIFEDLMHTGVLPMRR